MGWPTMVGNHTPPNNQIFLVRDAVRASQPLFRNHRSPQARAVTHGRRRGSGKAPPAQQGQAKSSKTDGFARIFFFFPPPGGFLVSPQPRTRPTCHKLNYLHCCQTTYQKTCSGDRRDRATPFLFECKKMKKNKNNKRESFYFRVFFVP